MNNKPKSLKVNAILNTIRSSLSIIAPLITHPYVLRVLGVINIGKVSYVSSVTSYFSLIAMLGISTYAVREGAKVKSDRQAINKFSSEVFTINVIFTLVAYALLAISVLTVDNFGKYKLLFLIQSATIPLGTISLEWVNTVYEDYLYITLRTIASYCISIISTFLFIKTQSDYYVYAIIPVATSAIICITNWFYCKKYVDIRLTKNPNWEKHFKRLLILFANAVTITIYVNFDNVMLGWMKGDYYTGLYALPTRIYSILKNLMISVYSVAIPRLALMYGEKRYSDLKNLYSRVWTNVIVILFPACIGLMCVSNEVVLLFGGEAYIESAPTLRILSLALIFAIFGGLITSCLNITIGREKDNLLSTVLSAAINCILNLFIIPLLYHNGTALTTLFAELFVFLFCFIRLPEKEKYLDFKSIFKTMWHVAIGSACIVVVSLLTHSIQANSIAVLLITMATAAVAYGAVMLVLKDEPTLDVLMALKSKIEKAE